MPCRVLIIFGATGCGKTDLLCQLFSDNSSYGFANKAEIINADSVQVYRDLRIGSAAPSEATLSVLPHHLVNELAPSREFSTADFVKRADELCPQIAARNHLPVLAGGTAFFLKNFIYGLPITPRADETIRSKLKLQAQTQGATAMYERLRAIDKVTADKLHPNDEYRVLRALEVYEATGKPLSEFHLAQTVRAEYDCTIIGLTRPREELYERINQRVDLMFEQGLYQEFCTLYDSGYRAETPAMKAIGYAEFFDVLPEDPKNAPLERVSELIKRNTRHYAKRQETFFKALPNVDWFDLSEADAIPKILKKIRPPLENLGDNR